MNDLSNQECVVCRADSPRIFVADSQEYMDVLKDWSINQMDSIDKLHRRYTFSNFSVALEFTNKIQSPQAGKSWAKRTHLKEAGGSELERMVCPRG